MTETVPYDRNCSSHTAQTFFHAEVSLPATGFTDVLARQHWVIVNTVGQNPDDRSGMVGFKHVHALWVHRNLVRNVCNNDVNSSLSGRVTMGISGDMEIARSENQFIQSVFKIFYDENVNFSVTFVIGFIFLLLF